MTQEKIFFKNNLGQKLAGTFVFPENKKPPFSLVIICHGFKGNKEGDRYRIIANELAKKGIASFRFDFHGHGMSEGKFENFTLSQAMFDLKSAYDFLISQNFLDKNHLGIFGHSLACFIILLFLIKFSPKIKAQVLVSSITDILDFKENWLRKNTKELNEIDNWQKKGFILVRYHNHRLPYPLKLNYSFWEDAQNYKSLLKEVKKINLPTLILHGQIDDSVSPRHSILLFENLACKKKLKLLKGVSHWVTDYLNGVVPMVKLTLRWFRKYL